jgi:hypothetical protein
VQILRQCRRKTTSKAPTALSAIQASSYYTPLVIRRNDKNKQLILLSQRKLALEVLSSEMDPAGIAKLGSFNRSSLKNPPAPHPPRVLQSIRAPPCFLIANYTTIKIAVENIHCALGLNLFFYPQLTIVNAPI